MGFSLPKIVLLFAILALTLVAGRLVKSGYQPSYLIVAGTDFVNPSATPTPITVQPGQGYDGQFFYRYALHPLNFSKDANGVTVDHPAYRMQRIGYPVLVWLLSLGGMPPLVPYTMVLVNILAFIGIGYFTYRFIRLVGGNAIQALYPLLLCGLYMSLARDLAEVTELCFFTGAVYYLFSRQYGLFSIFAAATILTRETSVIAFLPLLAWLIMQWRQSNTIPAKQLIYASLPFIFLFVWKAIIYLNIPSLSDASAGYISIGLPFKGIIMGFRQNFNLSDNKHILEFGFWLTYLAWQVAFVAMVLSKVSFRNLLQANDWGALKLVYLVWLLFALCFSDNIYGDDWGFVRVFSLWNMVGFLLLVSAGKKTGLVFNACSIAIVLLTIARLIIRV